MLLEKRRTRATPLIQEDDDAAVWHLGKTFVSLEFFLLLIPRAGSLARRVCRGILSIWETRTVEVVFPRSRPAMMRSRAAFMHLDSITGGWNVLRYRSCYLLRRTDDGLKIQLSRGRLPSLLVLGGSPATFLSSSLLLFE